MKVMKMVITNVALYICIYAFSMAKCSVMSCICTFCMFYVCTTSYSTFALYIKPGNKFAFIAIVRCRFYMIYSFYSSDLAKKSGKPGRDVTVLEGIRNRNAPT